MSEFVLDASTALTWCFEDEATAASHQVLDRLAVETASVPAIWPFEVANVLVLAERRRRITPAESTDFLNRLEGLAIEIDEVIPARAFARVVDLAREHRLTAYDASYLELAMRLGVPLATKDGPLSLAARGLGVSVIGGDR